MGFYLHDALSLLGGSLCTLGVLILLDRQKPGATDQAHQASLYSSGPSGMNSAMWQALTLVFTVSFSLGVSFALSTCALTLASFIPPGSRALQKTAWPACREAYH